jgi:hypothetical protein|tara:strand:+ start:5150 stop:5854 length:705 start_codon:yes stop_codon:yes gene_type:complete
VEEMINCLYANGDSWTEGDELGLPYSDNTPTYRLQNSWPKLLADKLQVPAVVNEAIRGTSGSRIARRTTRFMREWCNKHPGAELLVVVCWTTFERDELPIDWQGAKYIPYHNVCYNLPGHIPGKDELNVDPLLVDTINKMHKQYTTTLGSESRKQMQFERMWNLQQIAKSLNVKLVQTFALDEPGEDWNKDVNYITPSFIDMTKSQGWTCGTGGHTLEEGHKGWANYLYQTING